MRDDDRRPGRASAEDVLRCIQQAQNACDAPLGNLRVAVPTDRTFRRFTRDGILPNRLDMGEEATAGVPSDVLVILFRSVGLRVQHIGDFFQFLQSQLSLDSRVRSEDYCARAGRSSTLCPCVPMERQTLVARQPAANAHRVPHALAECPTECWRSAICLRVPVRQRASHRGAYCRD